MTASETMTPGSCSKSPAQRKQRAGVFRAHQLSRSPHNINADHVLLRQDSSCLTSALLSVSIYLQACCLWVHYGLQVSDQSSRVRAGINLSEALTAGQVNNLHGTLTRWVLQEKGTILLQWIKVPSLDAAALRKTLLILHNCSSWTSWACVSLPG